MTDSDVSAITRNLLQVRERIRTAAERAGRDPDRVILVAVTKTIPVARIRVAVEAGQGMFGENLVQEALPKIAALADTSAKWHFIGHLQTNKAKSTDGFDMIESVDSVRVAAALNRRFPSARAVLLEVNVSGEVSKWGFQPADLSEALAAIRAMPNLHVEGLMTVAPLTPDPETVRPVFRRLRELRDTHGLHELSMGMTNDFPIAIEEGATIVRVGRAIFGER